MNHSNAYRPILNSENNWAFFDMAEKDKKRREQNSKVNQITLFAFIHTHKLSATASTRTATATYYFHIKQNKKKTKEKANERKRFVLKRVATAQTAPHTTANVTAPCSAHVMPIILHPKVRYPFECSVI